MYRNSNKSFVFLDKSIFQGIDLTLRKEIDAIFAKIREKRILG